MERHTKHCRFLLLTIIAAILCACEHKPLDLLQEDKDYGYVKLNFDWSHLENPTDIPKGVTLYAYNEESGMHRQYLLSPDYDDYISIPVGKTILLFADNSNKNVELEGTSSFTTCHALFTGTKETDYLSAFCGGTERMEIEKDTAKHTLVLTPMCQTKHIEIKLTNCSRIATASQIIAGVTKLANSVNLYSGIVDTNATPVTMYSKFSATSGTEFDTDLRCLGVQNGTDAHKVIVSAYWIDGKIRAYSFESTEITKKIKSLAKEHKVQLELDLMDGIEIFLDNPDFPSYRNPTNTTIDSFEGEDIEIAA